MEHTSRRQQAGWSAVVSCTATRARQGTHRPARGLLTCVCVRVAGLGGIPDARLAAGSGGTCTIQHRGSMGAGERAVRSAHWEARRASRAAAQGRGHSSVAPRAPEVAGDEARVLAVPRAAADFARDGARDGGLAVALHHPGHAATRCGGRQQACARKQAGKQREPAGCVGRWRQQQQQHVWVQRAQYTPCHQLCFLQAGRDDTACTVATHHQ
jgi:hypothetical protein